MHFLGAKFKIPYEQLNPSRDEEEKLDEQLGKEDIMRALAIKEEYWPEEKELEVYVGENKAEKNVPDLAEKLVKDVESKVLQVKYSREKIQQEYEEAQKVLQQMSEDRFLDGDEYHEVHDGEKRGQFVQHIHSTIERPTLENNEAMLEAHRNNLSDLEARYWNFRKQKIEEQERYQPKKEVQREFPKQHAYDQFHVESFPNHSNTLNRGQIDDPFEKIGYQNSDTFDKRLRDWTPADLNRKEKISKYGNNVWESTNISTQRKPAHSSSNAFTSTKVQKTRFDPSIQKGKSSNNFSTAKSTRKVSSSRSKSRSKSRPKSQKKNNFVEEASNYYNDDFDDLDEISPEDEERFIKYYFDQFGKKKISKEEALILINRTSQLQELYDLKGEALKEEIQEFETKESGIMTFGEFRNFLKKGGSKNTCLLNKDQLNILEEVFKDTDVYEDLVVNREELVFKIRNDPRVVKFLSQPAVFIPSISKTLTLEKVLDFIVKEGQLGTEENKKSKEYVSLVQFMDYLKGYKAESHVSISLLRESKNMIAVKDE